MEALLRAEKTTFRGRIWSFAGQLSRGLQVLHTKAKLLHLDVKPKNLLWNTTTGQLQICDLGNSEGLMPDKAVFQNYCTPGYRPPELWGAAVRGLPTLLVPAVDVFAFGLVVYEAITGKMLLRPVDSRMNREGLHHSCLSWSKLWYELRHQKRRSSKHNLTTSDVQELEIFRARLCLSGAASVQTFVAQACHPVPKGRGWPSLEALENL